MTPTDDWDARVAALWAQLDNLPGEEFVAQVEALAAEKPGGNAVALFERACAQDSTGHSDRAAPLYRAALAAGLSGLRRRRAVIQLASSLRNVGQVQESLSLLTAERTQPSDELDDALTAFLALVLADLGREREALSLSLVALAPHLPRYQRSVGHYARALVEQD